jgi:putative membrane protein
MDLLLGTVALRPYVFVFLAIFLVAGARDLGWRRTLLFAAWVWPVAWLAEFSSTRTGVPFGLYHYTEDTRGRELFIANVPLMDSLSFTFLAYASYCLARLVWGRRAPSMTALTLLSGALMMLLDVVIDPLAVRGDRWFLGRIFYYPEGGPYFGVPLSNFLGWFVVGVMGVGGYLWLRRTAKTDALTRVWPGIALYYAVLGFNLAMTAWIGEWRLLALGAGLHTVLAVVLWAIYQRPSEGLNLEKQRA